MNFPFFSFPIATEAMYVRRFFNEETQDMAISMAKDIFDEYIETLKQTPWLDDKSRNASIRKANAMKFRIGYSKELTNDTLIDEYYRGVEMQANDSYLHSMFRIRRFLKEQEIVYLRTPVNQIEWIQYAFDWNIVNAGFYPIDNSICM